VSRGDDRVIIDHQMYTKELRAPRGSKKIHTLWVDTDKEINMQEEEIFLRGNAYGRIVHQHGVVSEPSRCPQLLCIHLMVYNNPIISS
jgi:hypothetical protein